MHFDGKEDVVPESKKFQMRDTLRSETNHFITQTGFMHLHFALFCDYYWRIEAKEEKREWSHERIQKVDYK